MELEIGSRVGSGFRGATLDTIAGAFGGQLRSLVEAGEEPTTTPTVDPPKRESRPAVDPDRDPAPSFTPPEERPCSLPGSHPMPDSFPACRRR